MTGKDIGFGKENNMSVKVTSIVKSYDEPAKCDIKVHSHWNDKSKIVLELEDKQVTVNAYDLFAAIKNAINTNGLT